MKREWHPALRVTTWIFLILGVALYHAHAKGGWLLVLTVLLAQAPMLLLGLMYGKAIGNHEAFGQPIIKGRDSSWPKSQVSVLRNIFKWKPPGRHRGSITKQNVYDWARRQPLQLDTGEVWDLVLKQFPEMGRDAKGVPLEELILAHDRENFMKKLRRLRKDQDGQQ